MPDKKPERPANPFAIPYTRYRKPMSLEELQLIQTRKIRHLESVYQKALEMGNLGLAVTTSNALTQAEMSFVKMMETVELAARVEALEERDKRRTKLNGKAGRAYA